MKRKELIFLFLSLFEYRGAFSPRLKNRRENKLVEPEGREYRGLLALGSLLILTTFLKNLIWSGTVPMWHFPDEQAHFGQVQLLVETGKNRKSGNDLSRDIYLSERLLGTERDWAGKNKFTHHPEFNIEYTESLIGKHEEEIKNFPFSFRKELVKDEAAGYPPLFYFLTSLFYRLVYSQDLMTRVFVSRFASIIFSCSTVYLAFAIGQLLFKKNPLYALALAILVSFQPMFTFTSSGTNSDNLMNLLFTVVIFLSLKILEKPKTIYFLSLFAAFGLGEYTKPHFKIAFLVLPFICLFHFKKTLKISSILTLLSLIFLSPMRARMLFLIRGKQFLPDVNSDPGEYLSPELSFPTHFIWTIRHTIAEVIPWYWGVFKWLGVALPRMVNRILNRVVMVAALGIVLKIIQNFSFTLLRSSGASEGSARQSIRKGHGLCPWGSTKIKKEKEFFFMIYISGVYFLALTVWDWFYTRSRGFSLGMQGRYFFPTIVPHMALILIGVISLLPQKRDKLREKIVKLLGVGMVLLNFIGLYTVTKSYYEVLKPQTLYFQISQYKPWFFKAPFLFPLFVCYMIVLFIFLRGFLKIRK